MSEKIIEFDRVVAGYSPSLTILNETTLDARKGEITLLIGPNGAGKSTVLKTLFGLLTPRSGEVRFEGKNINGKSQRELLADGIAFVPQGRNLFGSLSVRHNLELGGITLPRGELAGRIEEILQRFPRIRERIDNQASTLSGGEQKREARSRLRVSAFNPFSTLRLSAGYAPKGRMEGFRRHVDRV
jgi:branched-chain amino acid transport system ATP-binding protein